MGHLGRKLLLLTVGLLGGGCVFAVLVMLNMPAPSPDPIVAVLTTNTVTLPWEIPETPLVAEHLSAYEGPFLEDGSDTPVSDVAALLLRNTGTEMIETAQVILWMGEERLAFQAAWLPPGSLTLVLEKEGKRMPQGAFTAIFGWVQTQNQGENLVRLEEQGMGALLITNVSDRMLENVRLYHKSLYPEKNFYMGGIAYETTLGTLAPGETVTVQPMHYAAGYSRVVNVSGDKIE